MSTPPLRVVFAGTPDFAAIHLRELLEQEIAVVGVFTQPDRPAGRGKHLQPSPVKQLAMAHNLPVFQPPTFKSSAAQQQLQALDADVMIVVAYGLILSQTVLDIPRLGCLNVHGSLLPRWRGAAPIQRAIEAGDQETGITIMKMDAGLDTGPMLHKIHCPISPEETSASLYSKLAELGPKGLTVVLQQLAENSVHAQAQDNDAATYAAKLTKDDATIDWQLTASQLERKNRAFTPWPGQQTTLAGQTLKIHRIQCLGTPATQPPGTIEHASADGIDVATSDGLLRLLSLQLPGKKSLPVADILNGRKEQFAVGKQFGVTHEQP